MTNQNAETHKVHKDQNEPPEMWPSWKKIKEEWKRDPNTLPMGADEEDPCTDTDPHDAPIKEIIKQSLDPHYPAKSDDTKVP